MSRSNRTAALRRSCRTVIPPAAAASRTSSTSVTLRHTSMSTPACRSARAATSPHTKVAACPRWVAVRRDPADVHAGLADDRHRPTGDAEHRHPSRPRRGGKRGAAAGSAGCRDGGRAGCPRSRRGAARPRGATPCRTRRTRSAPEGCSAGRTRAATAGRLPRGSARPTTRLYGPPSGGRDRSGRRGGVRQRHRPHSGVGDGVGGGVGGPALPKPVRRRPVWRRRSYRVPLVPSVRQPSRSRASFPTVAAEPCRPRRRNPQHVLWINAEAKQGGDSQVND